MPKLEGRMRKMYYTELNAVERREFLRELNKDREKLAKSRQTKDANKGRRDDFRERMLTALHQINSNGGEDFVPLNLIVQPYGADTTTGIRCTVLQGKGNMIFDAAYKADRFSRTKIRELVAGVTGSVMQRLEHPELLPAAVQPPKDADVKADKPKAARKSKAKAKATVKTTSKPKAAKGKGK